MEHLDKAPQTREEMPSEKEIERAQRLLENIIKEFDYATLRDIARDDVVHAGGKPEHLDNISEQAISIIVDRPNPRNKASRPNMGYISTISFNAVRWATELKHFPEELVRMSVKKTMIHEFAHIVSNETYVPTHSSIGFGGKVPRMGFRQKRLFTGYFDILDEGTTDRLAFRWLARYVDRTDKSAKSLIPLIAEQVVNETGKTAISHFVMTGILEKISGASEMPKGDVWNSLVRHYFSTGVSSEVARELNRVFGFTFTRTLGKAETTQEMYRIEKLWKYMSKPSKEKVLSELVEFALGS